jgi:hypothetical protein
MAISLVNGVKPELIAASAYLMCALMVLFLLFDFSKYFEIVKGAVAS